MTAVGWLEEGAIHSVEISTIAHATDDLEKVQTALNHMLPEALLGRQIFTRKYMEGHHGNQIVTFEGKLTKTNDVTLFTEHFLKQLSRNERLRVERNLDLHSDDEGNLFIRLDKQRAYLGTLELTDEDPIRVRLKFSKLKGKTQNLMRQVLEME
jgi:RNA binding exosome subunit